jgi:hypothetical protein
MIQGSSCFEHRECSKIRRRVFSEIGTFAIAISRFSLFIPPSLRSEFIRLNFEGSISRSHPLPIMRPKSQAGDLTFRFIPQALVRRLWGSQGVARGERVVCGFPMLVMESLKECSPCGDWGKGGEVTWVVDDYSA